MAGTKKKQVLESAIEDHLSAECARLGIYQHKNTGRNGIPDRLLVFDGAHWFLELKRPGEVPTELQESVARELRAHGAVTLWADSMETVDLVVRAMAAGSGPPRERLYGLPKNLLAMRKNRNG